MGIRHTVFLLLEQPLEGEGKEAVVPLGGEDQLGLVWVPGLRGSDEVSVPV